MNNKTVLVLAPHTDDGELGCGGTISRLVEEGYNVYYVAFSACEESVPNGFPPDILRTEVKNATKILGVRPENLIVKNYPVRKFNSHRQDILEDMILLRRHVSPQIVFMPCSESLHQDHNAIYNEGIRAFKHYTCYGYDLPWDSVRFTTTAFYRLERKNVDLKWQSIKCYESQNFRGYVDEEFIIGLSRVRGAQIGEKYAEAFELLRMIN